MENNIKEYLKDLDRSIKRNQSVLDRYMTDFKNYVNGDDAMHFADIRDLNEIKALQKVIEELYYQRETFISIFKDVYNFD